LPLGHTALDVAIGRAAAPLRLVGARSDAPRAEAGPGLRLEPLPADTLDAIPLAPPAGAGPLFVGAGPLSYACSGCGRVLCQGIAPGDLVGLVLRCGCGAIGRVRSEQGEPAAREAVELSTARREQPRARLQIVRAGDAQAATLSPGEQGPATLEATDGARRLTPRQVAEWKHLPGGEGGFDRALVQALIQEIQLLWADLERTRSKPPAQR
jgi:hypothetical protein